MSATDQELPEDVVSAWMQAIEERRYHDAFRIGLASYDLARGRQDERAEQAALHLMYSAIGPMLPREEMGRCHFCGRNEQGLRLAAGPNALICEHCVNDLHAIFRSKVES